MFYENLLVEIIGQVKVPGVYHYYKPNENSTDQFNNYSSSVILQAGDFPPILDIEEPSENGTENLREGVVNWLKLAEINSYFFWNQLTCDKIW